MRCTSTETMWGAQTPCLIREAGCKSAYRLLPCLDVLVPLSLVLDDDGIASSHGVARKYRKALQAIWCTSRDVNEHYMTIQEAASLLVSVATLSEGVPCHPEERMAGRSSFLQLYR